MKSFFLMLFVGASCLAMDREESDSWCLLKELDTGVGPIAALALTADNNIMACVSDEEGTFWHVFSQDGEECGMAYSHNCQAGPDIVSADGDVRVVINDAQKGKIDLYVPNE